MILCVLCLTLTPKRFQASQSAKAHHSRVPSSDHSEGHRGTKDRVRSGRQEANFELPRVSWVEVTQGGED